MSDLPPARRVAHRPSAALAAALSFVLPGLGQAYAGRARLGLLFAAPVIVLAGMVLSGFLLGTDAVLRALVVPGALMILLVLNLGLLLWRLLAIGEAGLTPIASGPRSPATVAVVVLLILLTVGMHTWIATATLTADRALAQIFDPPAGTPYMPPAFGHLDPGIPDYRWDGTERVSILLIGYDSGPGRVDENTDTLMVATIDPVTRTAALVSVPRDTGYVPLPDRSVYADGVFPRRVNELASAANDDPALWCPDLEAGADCGLITLRTSIGLYLGLEIHHVAWVDLLGFAALVDAIGGVELCLPGVLADPRYSVPSWEGRGIVLEAGCRVYDGPHALAFARIRQGTMTMPDGTVEEQNDFLRAARQQEFLLAVQRQVAATNLLVSFPGLMNAVSETVTTDFPRTQAGDLASLARLIASGDVERVVLGWPEYVEIGPDPLTYYLLFPRRDAIRDEMASLLGKEPLVGWYLATGDSGPP
jgi:polyisoprenyl-teichoic acid--peptidoglycan teichoic acid transferase